jgi:hypothetical protein
VIKTKNVLPFLDFKFYERNKMQYKINWREHVQRMDDNRLPKNILTTQAGNPCTATRHVIFSSNHHSSAISWNIFIQFEVIVYETLLLPLVYLLSHIHVF